MNETTFQLPLEPTNPSHFFACCGLLELADRLWNGAEGWFTGDSVFCLRPVCPSVNGQANALLRQILECPLSNAMTTEQRGRRDELAAMPKKVRILDKSLEAEKKDLDAVYRESPVRLAEPFHLTLNWFIDHRSGGKELKTWAGQQSVVDIAEGMRQLIDRAAPSDEWLFRSVPGEVVPFNFDSDLGSAGSDLDLGFSIDPLRSTGLATHIHPLPEFATFVGLQRFRPEKGVDGTYRYAIWSEPLLPETAAAVVAGCIECLATRQFEFRLLYRTKYLKSFLSARAIRLGSD